MLLTKGRLRERLLDQRFWLDFYGMRFPRHHKFFETFDEKFQQMVTAGMIVTWSHDHNEYLNPKYYEQFKNIFESGDEPKVLTLQKLEAGFVICLASLLFALFAFIGEWLIRTKEYLVFTQIFTAYNEMKIRKAFEINLLDAAIAKYRKELNCERLDLDSEDVEILEIEEF